MQAPELIMPFPFVDLRQALTDIIDSVAAENKAIGHILDAESKMLEKARKDAPGIDGFADVNESVGGIVRSLSTIQLLSQYELADAENLLKNMADSDEYDEMEE